MSTFRRNTGIADALKGLRDPEPSPAVEEPGREESTPHPAPRRVSHPAKNAAPDDRSGSEETQTTSNTPFY